MKIPVLITLVFLVGGCATTERIVPAPVVLPDEGTPVSYAELHPKLRQLAWKATEAFYRDDWKDLGDTTQSLERAARLLRSTKDAPVRLQGSLAAKCEELSKENQQLREATQAAAIDRISGHLQRINNLVRELRPDASPL